MRTIQSDKGGPGARLESVVRQRLGEVLDDGWLCLYNCQYRTPKRLRNLMSGRQFGEADILLLNEAYGVVQVEVKGGPLHWDRGGLRHAGTGKEIRPDPFMQAQHTKALVIDMAQRAEAGYVPYEVFAALPETARRDPFGPPGYAEGTLFMEDLESPSRLRSKFQALSVWRASPERRKVLIDDLTRGLLPPVDGRPIRAAVREIHRQQSVAESEVFRFHDRQIEAFRQLERHERTVTLGPAGTGKTLLAVRLADKFARCGSRVLFFTPNSTQAKDIQTQLTDLETLYPQNTLASGPGVQVRSLPSLLSRDPEVILRRSEEQAGRWLDRAERHPPFDAVVVDECQDLTRGLHDAMLLLTSDGGSEIHAFGDLGQRTIADDHALRWDGYQLVGLTRVFRNTSTIHAVATRFNPDSGEPPEDITGIEPTLIAFKDEIQAAKAAFVELTNLTQREGVPVADIQLLLDDRSDGYRQVKDEWRRLVRGRKPIPPFPQSIHDFKGLEADHVILVSSSDAHVAWANDFYVGATRAKKHLVLIAREQLINQARGQTLP